MELEFAALEDIALELQKRANLHWVLIAWEDLPSHGHGGIGHSDSLSTEETIETLLKAANYIEFCEEE